MPNAPATRAPSSTVDDDALALLRLAAAGGSAAARRDLLDQHGSPAAALAAGTARWRAAGLDDRQVAALRSGSTEALEHAAEWLAGSSQRSLVGWHDPDYPPLLRRISSPPLALFVEGDAALLWRPVVAVVGSRAATVAGCEHAHGFALELARAGYVIGSGLASGVDAAAHRAALSLGSGNTLAVLGCGPDQAYPASHRSLLAQVASAGCVVSEHLPGVQARREFFPSRNRILAGLSLGTLVVEAGERSGALITARQAADAGREVFAIPGSIRNPLTRGCHRLIRDGATLVESAREVNAILSPLAAGQAVALRARLGGPTQQHAGECAGAGIRGPSPAPAWAEDADYNRLWKALAHDPTPMDQLVQRSGLTAAKLSSMLLVMELEGRVAVEHGRYSRK